MQYNHSFGKMHTERIGRSSFQERAERTHSTPVYEEPHDAHKSFKSYRLVHHTASHRLCNLLLQCSHFLIFQWDAKALLLKAV